MKKLFLIAMTLILSVSVMAQQKIQLRSVDKAECVKSDMTSLKASFSFSTIEAQDYESERGTFSWLSLPNTVLGGNVGDPQIPVVNQLIAVPFGATPRIEVTSYSTTDYRLADYDMHTLVPRQPSLRKDKRPEDVPFVYNASAYQSTRGLRSAPEATVSVEGTMRGVRLGKMTIEPVSYDPVNNTIRVFNNIEVTVHFDGADAAATEQMLIDTYSPYFDIVYKSLFNGRAVTDAYTDHPELYTTPVKMLVVTTEAFANSTPFQNWLTWKKQKGITVDVQTVASGASASTIKSLIYSRYNANHPTFLVIVGDETVVTYYQLWDYDSTYGNAATDLEYASVDGDVYHDMYLSRMPVANTTQLGYLVDKILMYEKYTMSDPSYLNETLLIAGWDSQNNWTNKVGKQTIQYANNYYFNSDHGITPRVFITTGTNQSTCYNYINQVGFINYTAHGDIQEWSDPEFTNSNVNSLTNTGKPFWAMGNCCLTCNFKNAQNSQTCYGETMVRAQNKAAFGYIGSVVESYWFEDFYFGVGAFAAQNSTNNNPTLSGTSKGAYDALFDDSEFNCLNSVPYIGNVAVTYAHAKNYSSSVTDEYYWRCYQCFGDGSVMPYLKVPAANTVSHNSNIPAGASSFRVNADGGSYVSITVNNEIIGVAAIPANATYVDVPFTTTPQAGQTAMIVVTRNQRQPYINNNVPIVGGTEYTISTNVNPANSGTVTGAGTYYENTECNLTATANHGYAFVNWSNNSTANPLTFTVTGNASYTANFRQLTLHHFTYNPQQDHGTISVSPADAYAGDIVTLTATPAAGYCLYAWHVTIGREEIPVVNNQFTMPDSDVTITAEFRSGYTITVATVANGTISANPTSAMPGDVITLSATPATGYELQCWVVYKTGDATTTMTVTGTTFTMPSYDVTVSAIFNTPTNTEVTIGSGTSTTNGANLPTNVYYKYSLTQQIYTAAEVGEAGTITAISFYYAGTTVGQRSSMDIYMSHTTSTSLSTWVTESSSNLVFSGGHAFSTGWNTITLDTPFAYNGTSNILLTVDDNTGSYTSSSQSFYTYSTSANRAIYYYNDNTNLSATSSNSTSGTTSTSNAQMKLTKVLDVDDNITVSPTALAGFTYMEEEGPSEAQTITITGHVSNDITVTAPTHYEVSTALNGTYNNTVTIPASGRGGRSTQTWDFEDGFDGWTTIDANNDGDNWTRSSILMAGYSIPSHSGSDGLSSASYNGSAITPDNWLISPQVPLGGSFTMWANAQDADYPAEHFGIYVSTTGNTNTSDFTLLFETTLTAKSSRSGGNATGNYATRGDRGNRDSGDWYDFTVDLSSYADQYGYIAIRHFGCSDQFYLNVDDFTLVYTGEMPVNPSNPNLDVLTANVYVRLKADLEADEYNETLTVATGSLSSNVTLSGEVIPNTGNQYTITVNANPTEGGTVAGGGTYYEGSHKTLTATPATHYSFTGWQLNGSIVSTDNPYTITVTGDATYTAVFAPMTAHNVAITQPTGGAITSDLATAYAGDVVTVTYTVESGYFFVEWSVVDGYGLPVEVTTNGQSAQFTMPDSNVTVTATFTTGYSITLNQTEHGTISADQTTALAPGTVVTMTATPDAGCVFVAWYAYKTGNPRDVVSVISNQYILMPASDVTVQAIFVTEEEHEANLGSGTNTNNYIPTYVRARYSLTQQIYLASELDNQKGRITKIAYRATTTAATRSLTIYMAHTEKTAFTTSSNWSSSSTDWEVMGSVAKVFEGSVSFNTSDWTTIELDTPFEYDGTSNINICVVDNSNATVGNNDNQATKFYRYSGTNRALYANGSSSYANTVGYSNQLSSTTGTRISYVSQIHITMMVPGSAESLTLSPGEMADFSYVENHGPSHTNKLDIVGIDLQNNITLNAPTNFEISLDEDGTYASSVTVQRETGSKGNRTVTSWGFEDGLDGWTAVDSDNDGYGWVLGSAVGGVYLDEGSSATDGHTGTGLVVSGSYTNVTGSALTPDNWLISPQINELGGSFSMWAKAQQAAYPAEHFGIYVSTTGTNPSNFTLLDEWTLTSADWKQFSVDLGLYTGQSGYIAVRHFNCTDQFLIKVDDFELDTEASITIEMPVVVTPATVYVRMKENLDPGTYSGTLTGAAGSLNGSVNLSGEVIAEYNVTLTANPVAGGTVEGAGAYADGTSVMIVATANEGYNFVNWTENGVVVSDRSSYIFTITADRDLVANFELITITKRIYGYASEQKGGWYLIASPLNRAVAPSNVGYMLANEYDLYRFNQGAELEWENYKVHTTDFVLEPGKGYLYANSGTVDLTFTGEPYNGDGRVTLTKTDSVAGLDCPGMNLVGNPFNQIAYLADNRPFYTMQNNLILLSVTNKSIEAMEGIFVEANENNEILTFTTTNPNSKGAMVVMDVSRGRGVVDRAIVRFGEGHTLSKFQLDRNSTKVYIPQDGKDYAVVSASEMGEMPVNFKAGENGTYTMSFGAEGVEFDYLHLIDNMTGKDVDLLRTPSYSFDATVADYESRFRLVFVTGAADDGDSFAFYSNGSWIIGNEGEATLQVVDVTGRILSSETVNGCVSKTINAASGVYMLRLINGDSVKVQKIVVR